MALHDAQARRRLVQARLRRERLEGRQKRLRHAGHARIDRGHCVGHAQHLAAAGVHAARRQVVQPRPDVHHDEDMVVYLNGVLAATATGFTTAYEPLPINAAAKATLKPGKNVLAVHCRQTAGGQYIDVGLVEQK